MEIEGQKVSKSDNPLVVAPDRHDRTDMTDRHTDAQTFLDSYTIGPSGKKTVLFFDPKCQHNL